MKPSVRICTYSGKEFDPLNPSPDDLDISDISHALSLKPRWTAQTDTLCSVGLHSLRVAAVAWAIAPADLKQKCYIYGLMRV